MLMGEKQTIAEKRYRERKREREREWIEWEKHLNYYDTKYATVLKRHKNSLSFDSAAVFFGSFLLLDG